VHLYLFHIVHSPFSRRGVPHPPTHAHAPSALHICFSLSLQPRLEEVYDQSSQDGSLHITLQLQFPHRLVKHAGAPARAWLLLAAPPDSDELQVTLVWQNKTATRLPEALWLRFKPERSAVAHHTWLMHKLDGAINPSEVRDVETVVPWPLCPSWGLTSLYERCPFTTVC
jgi:hypothetical protein